MITTAGETKNHNDPFDCALDDEDDYSRTSDPSTSAAIEAAVEEETIVARGRKEGREAGLGQGFNDGRLIGQKTGVEYGMEIGFATGLLEAVRQGINSGDLSPMGSLDRITKSANDLEKAIHDFPSSEESIKKRLFRSTSHSEKSIINISSSNNDNDDYKQLQRRDGSSEENIRAKLQRIRARCKVLAAKLGIPHHSLKTVLAEASQNKVAKTSLASSSKDGERQSESGGSNQDW